MRAAHDGIAWRELQCLPAGARRILQGTLLVRHPVFFEQCLAQAGVRSCVVCILSQRRLETTLRALDVEFAGRPVEVQHAFEVVILHRGQRKMSRRALCHRQAGRMPHGRRDTVGDCRVSQRHACRGVAFGRDLLAHAARQQPGAHGTLPADPDDLTVDDDIAAQTLRSRSRRQRAGQYCRAVSRDREIGGQRVTQRGRERLLAITAERHYQQAGRSQPERRHSRCRRVPVRCRLPPGQPPAGDQQYDDDGHDQRDRVVAARTGRRHQRILVRIAGLVRRQVQRIRVHAQRAGHALKRRELDRQLAEYAIDRVFGRGIQALEIGDAFGERRLGTQARFGQGVCQPGPGRTDAALAVMVVVGRHACPCLYHRRQVTLIGANCR
ncbi:MAG: hypothetical protein U5K76_03430 [Woeseiaceae bacterium]|nr:hypothetical protein [Woeseiaceae bacterium]